MLKTFFFYYQKLKIKTVIEEGKLEIDENIVQALLIEGFEFEVKPEETNITIAEFHARRDRFRNRF